MSKSSATLPVIALLLVGGAAAMYLLLDRSPQDVPPTLTAAEPKAPEAPATPPPTPKPTPPAAAPDADAPPVVPVPAPPVTPGDNKIIAKTAVPAAVPPPKVEGADAPPDGADASACKTNFAAVADGRGATIDLSTVEEQWRHVLVEWASAMALCEAVRAGAKADTCSAHPPAPAGFACSWKLVVYRLLMAAGRKTPCAEAIPAATAGLHAPSAKESQWLRALCAAASGSADCATLLADQSAPKKLKRMCEGLVSGDVGVCKGEPEDLAACDNATRLLAHARGTPIATAPAHKVSAWYAALAATLDPATSCSAWLVEASEAVCR